MTSLEKPLAQILRRWKLSFNILAQGFGLPPLIGQVGLDFILMTEVVGDDGVHVLKRKAGKFVGDLLRRCAQLKSRHNRIEAHTSPRDAENTVFVCAERNGLAFNLEHNVYLVMQGYPASIKDLKNTFNPGRRWAVRV
jgi:hypothetical protein